MVGGDGPGWTCSGLFYRESSGAPAALSDALQTQVVYWLVHSLADQKVLGLIQRPGWTFFFFFPDRLAVRSTQPQEMGM